MKPNLFIIGSPKCGTTFFCESLKNHPELFFTEIKELNYFSYKQLKEKSYYFDYKTEKLTSYLKHYKNSKNQKYLIDASVSYFTFEDIPAKIKEFSPNSKIIIMVRDPYKRAYSHYLMDKRMGYAKKDFLYYLNQKDSFHFNQYIGNSLYSKHYNNYLKSFDVKNIKIVNIDNLEKEFPSIFKFLKIKPIKINYESVINENKAAKNIFGKLILKYRNFVVRLKPYVPFYLHDQLKKLFFSKPAKNSITPSELKLLKSLIDKDYNSFTKMIKNLNKAI